MEAAWLESGRHNGLKQDSENSRELSKRHGTRSLQIVPECRTATAWLIAAFRTYGDTAGTHVLPVTSFRLVLGRIASVAAWLHLSAGPAGHPCLPLLLEI